MNNTNMKVGTGIVAKVGCNEVKAVITGIGENGIMVRSCKEWTPLIWLPKEERGKKAESWFMCEFCSGHDITLRYLSEKEAVAKNLQYRPLSADLRTSTGKGVQRAWLSRATHP